LFREFGSLFTGTFTGEGGVHLEPTLYIDLDDNI